MNIIIGLGLLIGNAIFYPLLMGHKKEWWEGIIVGLIAAFLYTAVMLPIELSRAERRLDEISNTLAEQSKTNVVAITGE